MNTFNFHRYEVILLVVYIAIMQAYLLWNAYRLGLTQAIHLDKSYLGMRDSHDIQWEAFRSNIPIMLLIGVCWKLIGSPRYRYLVGMTMTMFAFRADAILYFILVLAYYLFCQAFYDKPGFVLYAWILAILTLLMNQYLNRFRSLSLAMESLITVEWFKNSNHLIHWASLLNIAILRLLSFGIDYHRNYYHKQDIQKHYKKCIKCEHENPCIKARDLFAPPEMNLHNFLNYVFFPCTFLAGPPISYNSFHSFRIVANKMKNPLWRFLLTFISFQIFQTLFPTCKPSPHNSLFQLEVISLMHLVFIWYKLINIWRFARVWSYYEGIQIIDNISRCICNNYGFVGFWRMWNRGFNIWLVRYLYIPLGGKQNILAYVFVFLFTAFWHDAQLKLLIWAGIILAFMIPELYLKNRIQTNYAYLYKKHWFKYACALCGSMYIYLMCIANLIAFGFGYEGLLIVLIKIKQQIMVTFLSILTLAAAVLLMFYVRNQESEDVGY